jgi:hypothetical protein
MEFPQYDFPCAICTKKCNQNVIECNNCRNWVHAKCANLSSNELKSWSGKSLKYLCKCCSFKGEDYDAEGALSRSVT